jgi:glutamate decarboxylase
MRSHRVNPRHMQHSHTGYHNEKHSLQGKAGKTHGVC